MQSTSCISDIRSWMIGKKLKINDDKTEFLIITSPKAGFSANLQLKIGQEIVLPSTSCKSLGVMFDDHMQMDAHISLYLPNHTFSPSQYWSNS